MRGVASISSPETSWTGSLLNFTTTRHLFRRTSVGTSGRFDDYFSLRFERSLRHFCSSRSTSSFGTATMRFVRFDNRSSGVRPGTVIFMFAALRIAALVILAGAAAAAARKLKCPLAIAACQTAAALTTGTTWTNVSSGTARQAIDSASSVTRRAVHTSSAITHAAGNSNVHLFSSGLFFRALVAASISQHVSGSSLPVSAV